MAAELAQHFFPNMVELHNYPPANSTTQKLTNWRTLNRKCRRETFQDMIMNVDTAVGIKCDSIVSLQVKYS